VIRYRELLRWWITDLIVESNSKQPIRMPDILYRLDSASLLVKLKPRIFQRLPPFLLLLLFNKIFPERVFQYTYLQNEYSYIKIKIPIYSVYLKFICLWDQKYIYIFIIYLKSIKSIISENVINCCLASSALTQFWIFSKVTF
jgi:hypothetical protein